MNADLPFFRHRLQAPVKFCVIREAYFQSDGDFEKARKMYVKGELPGPPISEPDKFESEYIFEFEEIFQGK